MANIDIDMNSELKLAGGKTVNMVEFADRYGLDIMNPDLVIAGARLLLKRGQVTIVDRTSKEEQQLESAFQEEAFQQVVYNLDAEQEAHRQAKRQQALNNTDSLRITLAFITSLDSAKFANWLSTQGITEVSEIRKNGAIKLLIEDITPQEYTKIANKYKAENAITAGVQATSKLVNGTTNAVNYGLTEVVAPTAKIVGEAGMNLGKGLFHTGVKTLAGLVNSGAKAVSDTKVALATDPDCLRATRQLQEAKNTMKRGVAKRMNQTGMGNGIEIL